MSEGPSPSSAPCPHCQGTGRSEDLVAVTDDEGNMGFELAPCPHCRGRGTRRACEEVRPSSWVPDTEAEG